MQEKAVLPEPVGKVVAGLVESTRDALGSDLKSIVLYGSAAEGKLRKTSDVNVIIVIAAFDPTKVDRLREPLRTAHAAIRLEPMLLLDSEIPLAADAFAVKFADILQRRSILHGPDPFVGLTLSRDAEIARLKQVLLNLVLRLRQRYLLRSLRDEQMAALVADTAAPIRTCAEALLQLQGKPAASPKEALGKVVAGSTSKAGWDDVLRSISEARETRALPPEVGRRTVLRLIDLASEMYRQVQALA